MHEKSPPQEGMIKKSGGHRRILYDGYWVRYYDPMERGDLEGALKLLNSFEWRLQKAVENGMESTPDEQRIADQQKLYDAARHRKEAITDENSHAYKQALSEEQVFGGMLAVSIYRHALAKMKTHIILRKEGKGSKEELDTLEGTINQDIAKSFSLFDNARRAGGIVDRDEVIKEMRGEPIFIFNSTLAKSNSKLIEMFHTNRYRKTATCFKEIDEMTQRVQRLLQSSDRLGHTDLPRLVDALANNGKSRCELRRADQPDYDIAVGLLESARNQIRDFTLDASPKNFTHKLTSQKDEKILRIVQDYNKLVYDIAHVRTPRKTSTTELIERMDAILEPPEQGVQAAI